jgi:translocation protein SEC62
LDNQSLYSIVLLLQPTLQINKMQQPPPNGPRPMGMPPNFQPPTPEQMAQIQQRLQMEAQRAGMSVPQYVEQLKAQAAAQQQARMQMMQQQAAQGGPPGQPQHQHQHGPGHDHDHSHSHPHPHQHGPPQGQPQPIQPGPPTPQALALAKWLKNQQLKPRTCILNGERKDMFRGPWSLWIWSRRSDNFA